MATSCCSPLTASSSLLPPPLLLYFSATRSSCSSSCTVSDVISSRHVPICFRSSIRCRIGSQSASRGRPKAKIQLRRLCDICRGFCRTYLDMSRWFPRGDEEVSMKVDVTGFGLNKRHMHYAAVKHVVHATIK